MHLGKAGSIARMRGAVFEIFTVAVCCLLKLMVFPRKWNRLLFVL
jgi:hypothetical protein